MAFEKFRKKPTARSKGPLISIRKEAYIAVNGKAVQAYFGQRRHVHLLFDEEKRRVGIKPLRDEEIDPYAVRCRNVIEGKGVMIYAATFLRHYGIAVEGSRIYAPRWDGQAGMLVIDLDRPV